jgi:hypothetical protein
MRRTAVYNTAVVAFTAVIVLLLAGAGVGWIRSFLPQDVPPPPPAPVNIWRERHINVIPPYAQLPWRHNVLSLGRGMGQRLNRGWRGVALAKIPWTRDAEDGPPRWAGARPPQPARLPWLRNPDHPSAAAGVAIARVPWQHTPDAPVLANVLLATLNFPPDARTPVRAIVALAINPWPHDARSPAQLMISLASLPDWKRVAPPPPRPAAPNAVAAPAQTRSAAAPANPHPRAPSVAAPTTALADHPTH